MWTFPWQRPAVGLWKWALQGLQFVLLWSGGRKVSWHGMKSCNTRCFGVAPHTCSELKKLVEFKNWYLCMCMFCIFLLIWLLSLGAAFCVSCFLQSKLHRKKHKICVILKSFPNITIALKQIFIFQNKYYSRTDCTFRIQKWHNVHVITGKGRKFHFQQ